MVIPMDLGTLLVGHPIYEHMRRFGFRYLLGRVLRPSSPSPSHPLNPQISRVKREPLLRIREKTMEKPGKKREKHRKNMETPGRYVITTYTLLSMEICIFWDMFGFSFWKRLEKIENN
jgi:hypothetical protein